MRRQYILVTSLCGSSVDDAAGDAIILSFQEKVENMDIVTAYLLARHMVKLDT
jgi:hypothetical protein